MSQHPLVPNPGNNLTNGNNKLVEAGTKLLQQSEGTYIAKIKREQPTALVFLIDQSGSMSGGGLDIKGIMMSKADAAAHIINTALEELLKKSTRDNELRNYIDFVIIGYGKESKATMAWSGKLTGKTWVTTAELGDHAEKTKIPHRAFLPDGSIEEETIEVKTWFKPVSSGSTPMLSAINLATGLISEWIKTHETSYPPIVINITDGEATDAKPPQLLEAAEKLKQLRTNDGRVLFLNCHLSNTAGASVLFPSNSTELPKDDYAKLLYEMSSVMPEKYRAEIEQAKKTNAAVNYKGMTFNADGSRLVQFIVIGSSN